MTRFSSIDHVSIPVGDTNEAIAFYKGLLGLEQIDRPDFDFPGAWFQCGHISLHLTTGSKRDSQPHLAPNEAHVAFTVEGLDGLVQRLTAANITIHELVNSPAARKQLFFHDPWGNMLEMIEY